MNVPLPLESVRQNVNARLDEIRRSRFFHDRISMILLVGALAVNVVSLGMLLLHWPAVHADIPTRYSTLGGFDALGPWYSPFVTALFGPAVTLVNGVLAYQAFGRSRLASFYLLCGSVVVGLFCLIIANAFATVVQ